MRQKLSFSGAFRRDDPDLPYRYLAFDMPPGAKRLEVSYHFSRNDALQPEWGSDDVVDIGVFDARGIDFLAGGFRGWTGSARRSFEITPDDATPGYIRGPLQPGQWNIFLGVRIIYSDVLPYWVHVSIDSDPTDTSASPAFEDAPRVAKAAAPPSSVGRYVKGDFHSHTIHSDGYNTIDEYAVEAARLGLDFLAITDHNTSSHFAEIAERPQRERVLLLPGEEVTTFWGHANVWGLGAWVDFRCTDDGGMQQIIDWVHERGGLFSPNHPKTGWPWEFTQVRGYRVCETWQGAWRFYNTESLEFWERRLDAGERVTAVGGSDCHSIAPAVYLHPWSLGTPCTWVFADEPLSEEGILAAVRAGHVFLSEDTTGPFLELTASCNGRGYVMGDTIEGQPGDPLRFRVRYHGPDGKRVRLFRNGALWHETVVDRGEAELEFELALEEPGYVRADVVGYRGRPERGEVVHALTNPIYLEVPS
ncbi:MAG: CehA/McbA family metallohydrolase [Dehalococcoidia bacterium]